MTRGTSTMLIGPPGSGKTYALSTLADAGLKVAIIFTDPGGDESLIDACAARNTPLDNIHWRYVTPANPSWGALTEAATKVNRNSYEDLAKLKSGVTKREYTQFIELLATLANFKCEHCSLEIGPVDHLDSSWAVVLDGLSGVNVMAMKLTIGGKPTAHEGEWGVAMNLEEGLIQKLTADLDAFFILIGHVEREPDLISGTRLMVGALGKKLAPKLPRTFSDIVLACKERDKFTWSTIAMNVDLKTRTLPLSDTLEPSFVQIVDRWQKRAKLTTTQPTGGTS